MASGTEPTPGARAQEAARLISQFVGDLCVVALASEDRRTFGPFAVESRNEAMTAMMRQAIDGAARERAAWPLAGRALVSGEPVVIDRIRPGELEGIVNPAMDQYLGRFGMSAVAFVAMRGEHHTAGVIGMGRGPGRPAYTRGDGEAAQRIADAVADDTHGEPGSLLPLLLIDGAIGTGGQAERRFSTLVERLPAIVYEAEPGAQGLWLYVSGFVETLLGLIADLQQARVFGEALERLGLRMSLDDFGDGLGSFSSLRALPVDDLRIDGQFVGGLAGNPFDREIVKAIVALARAAGRRTVAEFVSDQETLELLAELGVDLAQGFHVGRPRPLEEL